MPLATADYVAAIAHLPSGLALCAAGVTWEDYENLLSDLGDESSVRVFYNQGKMEIMSPPTKEHETPRPIIYRFIVVLSEELDIEISSVGTTTLKRRLRAAGAEPDDAFYIRNIGPALGTGELNLERDPPPHIVLEIDRTSLSLDKFALYAALGVPEIWRLHKGVVSFHHLTDNAYAQHSHSRAFPFLSTATLTEFVQHGLREGETKAAKAFRVWLKGIL